MVYRFIMLACHASETGSTPVGTANYGPMVKRSRHHPFTVVSRVRIPVGSPYISRSGAAVARRAHNPKVAGSIPVSATNGLLTQLGECYPCKVEVRGSSPLRSTKKLSNLKIAKFLNLWYNIYTKMKFFENL